jgi:large subunit ribosomal protein L20
MTRVKKAVNALKSRKNTLRKTKGYRHGRSKKEREATEAIFHAGTYAFAHRRDKKGDARKLWNVKISYAAKGLGTSYSKLMGSLKKKGIMLDRKILAILAAENPETFKKVANFSPSPAKPKEKVIV